MSGYCSNDTDALYFVWVACSGSTIGYKSMLSSILMAELGGAADVTLLETMEVLSEGMSEKG